MLWVLLPATRRNTLELARKKKLTPEIKKLLEEIEHALIRIQENVKRGGEIVGGLLKYTRKGEQGFAAVELNALIDASLEMTQFKIKMNEFTIVREIPEDCVPIKGKFYPASGSIF